ncbi:MAG: TatD family hydrolase [Bacteroidaceae bacterium]|nr:TatD family hydrolase [Bacteroidaceae bacterium]
MIDTHSHLDGEEFAEDLEDVLQRAQDAGVEKIFVPGICLKDTPHLLEVCNAHPGYLYPMIGLHPENIMDEDYHHALDELEKILVQGLESPHPQADTPPLPSSASPIIAIGEVGLDLYWDATHRQEQLEVFEQQIRWAEKYDLPLMIHSRNAHAELMETMERHRGSNLSGVFHCFTGTEEEARDLLTFPNFMLGIGGVLTFKKSTLPEVVKNAIPLSRIVLETDSPYMAPVPNRGKRNESAYVKSVAEKLAEVFEVDFDEIVLQTTKNAGKVFKKVTFFNKN